MDKTKRAIITVVGKDRVGIIARVCTYLAQNDINILDISQTITGGFFDMMMIVDVAHATNGIGDITDALSEIGRQLGLQIQCQGAEIFEQMHRL